MAEVNEKNKDLFKKDSVYAQISRVLVESINLKEMLNLKPSRRIEKIYHTLKQIVEKEKIVINHGRIAGLVKEIYEETFEYGPISQLMKNNDITEIMINDWDKIYIEAGGNIRKTRVSFNNKQHLRNMAEKIISPLGLRLDESCPMADARLADGSRINTVISPVSIQDTVVTIRKFKPDLLCISDLLKNGTLDERIASFIKSCVLNKINIIISGATSTGKTTFLNIIANFISKCERIITIEETLELDLHCGHVVKLEARPASIEGRGEITIRDLVKNSLRMRPDRIIVGEIRGNEAIDVLQAMNTGHEGSMTTVHANSPLDLLSRLETMLLLSAANLNPPSARRIISSSVDLIIHLEKTQGGKRIVSRVSELTNTGCSNVEGHVLGVKDIFVFDGKSKNSGFLYTGYIPGFVERIEWKKDDFRN